MRAGKNRTRAAGGLATLRRAFDRNVLSVRANDQAARMLEAIYRDGHSALLPVAERLSHVASTKWGR